MPLIDEAVNLLDNNLMDRIANNFTSRNGLIIDNDGNCWYRWRSDGLDSWWRFFEEIIDAPMGRKLVNSACDEEEWLLNSGELDHSGLFRKKKIKLAFLVFTLFLIVIPFVAKSVPFVSLETEIAMGKAADVSIIKQVGLYQDKTLQLYVNDIGQNLVSKLSDKIFSKYYFRVIKND